MFPAVYLLHLQTLKCFPEEGGFTGSLLCLNLLPGELLALSSGWFDNDIVVACCPFCSDCQEAQSQTPGFSAGQLIDMLLLC